MALVKKIVKPDTQRVSVLVDKVVANLLHKYVAWNGGSLSYVVEQAVKYVIDHDKEFQEFLGDEGKSNPKSRKKSAGVTG